jgi:uncharacterized protein YgiM (DUF1202 family)
MKTLLFAFTLVLSTFSLNAQSYLGYATKNVNLRQGPGTNYEIDTVVKQNAQLFLFSLDAENNFYHVIDVKTNIEGYLHKDFVKVGKEIKAQQGELFIADGKSSTENPELEIYNNTTIAMTLRIGSEKYYFTPQETKKIILSPSEYDFMASAPGVIPYYGSQYLNSNYRYTWKFFIVEK